jgi:hypothetical protein
MTKKLTGKLAPTGFVVMETYNVHLDIPVELQAAFEKNPEKFIRQFLRENGQKVNSVRVMKSVGKTISGKATRRRRDHWFHIIFPKNERSGWICDAG